VILAEYTGALLLGASASALGLFLSSISKNQAAAFVGSAVVLLAFNTGISMLANNLGILPAGIIDFLYFFSLSYHFESFSRGLLDSRDIAFFAITAILFLFLNVQVLVYRRWK
jgi:ABC-2 type transport system permease protein